MHFDCTEKAYDKNFNAILGVAFHDFCLLCLIWFSSILFLGESMHITLVK